MKPRLKQIDDRIEEIENALYHCANFERALNLELELISLLQERNHIDKTVDECTTKIRYVLKNNESAKRNALKLQELFKEMRKQKNKILSLI